MAEMLMATQIDLDEIVIDVVRKNIKNLHLRVYPPTGRVLISAPLRMSLNTIRLFAVSKLDWIRSRQKRMREWEIENRHEYLDHESHYVWGMCYQLRLIVADAPPRAQLRGCELLLRVRPGSDETTRKAVAANWYRQILKEAIAPLIEAWEPRLDVKVSDFCVRQMKTRWGSCNTIARTIRFNTELAKKPKECLEYVVVHEMAHLLERTHGPKFLAVMDRFMPDWRDIREALNHQPMKPGPV